MVPGACYVKLNWRYCANYAGHVQETHCVGRTNLLRLTIGTASSYAPQTSRLRVQPRGPSSHENLWCGRLACPGSRDGCTTKLGQVLRIVAGHVRKVRTFHLAVLDRGAGRLGCSPCRAVSRCAQVGRDHARWRFRLSASHDDRACGARRLQEKAFPELASKSSVVLVVARPDGELTNEDKSVALRLADRFTPKPDEKTPVASVMTHDDRFVGRQAEKSRRPVRARFVAVEQRVHGRR